MTPLEKRTHGIHYAIPGLGCLVLLAASLVIADVRLWAVSAALGTIYAICVPVFFLPVFYWYCRKCPHAADGTCRHVIFGRATKALFTLQKPAPYSTAELILSLGPLGLLVLFPQYWLFAYSVWWGAAFWVPLAVAGVIVRVSVCPGCGNRRCALCPKRSTT
jgi:hypothetical protein